MRAICAPGAFFAHEAPPFDRERTRPLGACVPGEIAEVQQAMHGGSGKIRACRGMMKNDVASGQAWKIAMRFKEKFQG